MIAMIDHDVRRPECTLLAAATIDKRMKAA